MQLVSNDSCKEDISESEPILSHSNISQHSEEESPSSLEIKSLGGDCEIHVDDLESIQIDETCHLVNPDQPQCRICLDNEGEDLIAPCHCKGTQKYVHRSCLDNWRSTKWSLVLNVSAAMEIEIFVNQEDVNCCILGCAGVQVLWGGLRESLRYGEHPYGFYTMAVLAIVLVGLLYGFFIAIICGQRINERHYHVLAKQELTKEYVVEDREASKDVPELGASHVSELRMLGLY
ncbi:hypothetical protein D5086_021091 [Populus alba]|uniref:Uncharacterized protein n=1 Tax=Populus alba TaxID=43335 RepID=A0ACC4BMI4_POPAL